MTFLRVDNPFTLDTACELPLAEWAEVETALECARDAARSVRRVELKARIELVLAATAAMEARAESIAADISRMMGKPISQARGEVRTMAVRARAMSELAAHALAELDVEGPDAIVRQIEKRPLGVVLDLPAWNYPLLTAVNVVMPAVLAGNAVVLRHSPRTPLCGEHFARAFRDVGAPNHLVQALVVEHALAERAVADARVDHVVFTGSVFGGERVSRAAAGRFLQIGYELGGNDAAYVASDCDVAYAAENLVDGAIYNAGQSCCAVERIYVHASLYDAFVEAALPLVRAYALGDPLDERITLGPIAQPDHVTELEGFVRDALRGGARLLHGGRPTNVDGRGRFFEPTLLTDVPADARLLREESFGPIVAVHRVDSDAQALARMNDNRYGLTASVWTRDAGRAHALARELEVGTVFMNRCDYVDPYLPWSGVGLSGRGHSLSALGFDQLTRPRALHLRAHP